MSALNAYLTADAAHIFADGTLYSANDGVVRGVSSKLICLPHLDAVVGAVGYAAVGILATSAFAEQGFETFDDLLANAAKTLSSVYKSSTEKTGIPQSVMWGDSFIIGIAGWSRAADAPKFISIANFDRGVRAFEAVPARKFYHPEEWRTEFEADDPIGSGLQVMRAQRLALHTSLHSSDPFNQIHAVGAFCQHACVTRDGINTKVLEKWPDKIGHRIMP